MNYNLLLVQFSIFYIWLLVYFDCWVPERTALLSINAVGAEDGRKWNL